ncbi:vacuolar protein-sorting protein BRO1 [Yarrowia lipolytica]|uniref:Vacuolar protein-sorting protein BRO1 n=1 Tax=Yarrowia lipolytica (strain CLIB 122 / E 150) TaxID=284591 RepID=BRO1_YARLI|nr:YALI0A18766p [Yarrowia lipolytica CLIB122]Q6CGJ5.1 RecName: Full=Vacuolar protein-sorting protein BRO1; AltName: Full=BRO domain-containing protein 1 [Yarrowia lipolytica CLIB122]RDW32053.1 vacuolar protein-sorting protein BRO1 [Yarrowia lipolytica]RDW48387.1 vacuolar protein-sorting protein BRO1 [Yarrowia lipolytica]RDW54798.1 vacuolar protein-sorting protein BRO1 [Yarrowia lipolytica]CAG84150.1 YALI0A18766p [Yarrowia lipolytica CLIB122]|eukprot:XP_500217.1 YALI0A18766p [Yarrowia lipolytica CLIB122]
MIPLALKTTESTDWSRAIHRYIASSYGPDYAEQFREEISSFQRLRQDIRGAGRDATGRDILFRYFAQLDSLERRINAAESGMKPDFTWSDSLSQEKVTQHSISFEKANVLYQLGAILSCMGEEMSRDDSCDPKASFHAFQNAAGVFAFIADKFLHAPLPDIGQDVVRAFNKLMLAQAQEMFCQDSIAKSVSVLTDVNQEQAGKVSALTAKLCAGVGALYKAAFESFTAIQEEQKWGDKNWPLECQGKNKYFTALGSLLYAKSLQNKPSTQKFGESIGYIQKSINEFNEASMLPLPNGANKKDFNKWYRDLVSTALDLARSTLKSSEHDNDLIYHSLVPAPATLGAVEPKEVVTATPLQDMYKEEDHVRVVGRDLFTRLVPMHVLQQTSVYSEEKASLLRSEGERIEVADQKLNSALEYMGLPGELYALKKDLQSGRDSGSSAQVPAVVLGYASEVKTLDLSPLKTSRDQILTQIRDSQALIASEETESTKMKDYYKDGWTQAPSAQVNASLLSDIRRVQESLVAAGASDEKLQAQYDGVKPDIELLSRGINNPELEKLFDADSSSSKSSSGPSESLIDLDFSQGAASRDPAASSTLDKLLPSCETSFRKLQNCQKDRQAIFYEFKDKVHRDDISGVLVNSKGADDNLIFEQELEKFQPYQQRLTATINTQALLIKDLADSWEKITRDPVVKNKVTDRKRALDHSHVIVERFRKAFESWKQVKTGLDKGLEFYRDLQNMADKVNVSATQFVNARRQEGKSILSAIQSNTTNELQSQLGRLSFGSGSSSAAPTSGGAPTLPPKPQQHTGDNYGQPSTYDPSVYGPNSPFMQQPPQHQQYGQPPHHQQYGQNPPPPPQGANQNQFWNQYR